MAKLTRETAKIFGETASTTNTPVEIGQFGSAKAGTYNATGDIATIQSLSAWSNGWIDAVTPTDQFPPLPEMTAVHKVLSYQNAYVLQQGMPEWDSATTYYANGFCSQGGLIYRSIEDNNLNNSPSDSPTKWEIYGAIKDYANQSLTNLTSLGNARLQYAPFAINSGTVENGKNATLKLPGGSQTTQEIGFFQPIMTANGTTGGSDFAVFASSEITSFSRYAYKAFNGDTGYTGSDVWEATGSSPQYIGWYNPNPMKMDSLTIRNGFSDHFAYVVTAGEIQYSNDGTNWTTEQTFTNSVTSNGAYWTINITSPVLSNYKRIYITSATNDPMIANIQFNNAKELVTITASATVICDPCVITTCDGRTLVDENASVFEVTDEADGSYFVFKNQTNGALTLASSLTITNNLVLEQAWTQPVLSDNGTLGGASFAVSNSYNTGSYYTWKMFDGDSSTAGALGVGTGTLTIYNPDALKVSKFEFLGWDMNSVTSVQGSNDGTNYTPITFTSNKVGSTVTATLTNDVFYKYYQIGTAGASNYYAYECTITATIEVSPSNGTYWLDTSITPAKLKVYDSAEDEWTINNDLVWIGNCSISGGAITAVENRLFNDNGYSEGTATGASWAMPSDTYENLTLGASGTTYTAPANGWYFIHKGITANTQSIRLGCSNKGYEVSQYGTFNGAQLSLILPVQKGDTLTVAYDAAGTTHAFRFIYAVGSESEYTP